MSQHIETPDPQAGHRYFSVYCFNHTWDLLDKASRSKAEDEAMLQSCLASLWHWNQRPDCTDQNRSIGAWQASRVFAVLEQADNARRYGQMSLDFARGEAPFYRAYAHEALARAEALAGDSGKAQQHLKTSRELAAQVQDPADRQLILDDLKTI